MINPGTEPVDGREDLATANLATFLDAVRGRAAEMDQVPIRYRVAALTGDPRRDPAADRDGRFGWDLPFDDGRVVRLLMPGVELPRLRDDLTARAPCLYVNGSASWWNGAVDLVAGEGLTLTPPT
ncbi:hypothetical protein GCM10010172_76200 [Paractinoplanes ferrugineus]|uniref:Uncharacterized protein n=1 Tax=Paractinoplanes ferrugineus TaxID=113564 RepID=A0A919J602_9ACTN|nr:hypothetical protein [Actinoplanes ferrugineus]GIE11226.1 hypothetical protein Afe05nite_30660 [Actinoplanes ferrugineus]